MILIHAPEGSHPQPYSLTQLRQDNPNVSFPANPTAADLAPFDVFPVEPTPRPNDTREQRHDPADPQQAADGSWRQAWVSRPATDDELAAWDAAHAPPPDWGTFRGALLISENVAAVMTAARLAGCEPGVTALPVALEKAVAGDPSEFARCWALVVAAANAAPELLTELVSLAISCNLPAGFVEALQPTTERF